MIDVELKRISADALHEAIERHRWYLGMIQGGARACLKFCDLSRYNLSGCNLEGADLTGCRLHGAKLNGTNLKGACLYGADFSSARSDSANLSKADLRGASFRGARMVRTDLTGADLRDGHLVHQFHGELLELNVMDSTLPIRLTQTPTRYSIL